MKSTSVTFFARRWASVNLILGAIPAKHVIHIVWHSFCTCSGNQTACCLGGAFWSYHRHSLSISHALSPFLFSLQLPTVEEIEALLARRKLRTIVFFLDETFEELEYDVTTTVLEAVEQIAGLIALQNYTTFTLFECKRSAQKAMDPAMDEHTLLDDHKYIADVLHEFQNPKVTKDGIQSRLLFKKRMFRETDEAIQEAQFLNLSYVQAQHDFLLGNYPVVREDAAQMCALQILAEYGPKLKADDRAIPRAIEKYMSRQFLMTRPREDWRMDVISRYNALSQYTKEDSRMQFLRVLRSLPYGEWR